jgi:thioredoxin-dependent peroxiredoxin
MSLEGKKAPAFNIEDENGEKVALKDFSGKYVVLFFYPRDNTPGCTKEACRFTDLKKKFEKLDAVILGCSADTIEKHQNFISKHKLGITLLSDPDKKVIQKYDAWGEKNLYGKKSMGIIRSTIIIDPKGKVAAHWKPVRKADQHPDVVLEKLKEIVSE